MVLGLGLLLATVELTALRSVVFSATFLPNGSDKRQQSGRMKAVGLSLGFKDLKS